MHLDAETLRLEIDNLRSGDQGAGDRLCSALRSILIRETARMLGDDDQDVEDVVQESLVATLGYLDRERGFQGDLVRLAVTITRNRCRDILRLRARRPQVAIDSLDVWLSSPGRSALDDIAESEQRSLLQAALDQIGQACRRLLHALYVEGNTPEQVRAQIGLGTVQGVYHRRSVCLSEVKKLVQRHLKFGSWTKVPDWEAGRNEEGPE